MPEKKPGGPLPKQTGTTTKTPGPGGGTEAKPVTPNKNAPPNTKKK